MARQLPNGARTEQQFDPLGRLTQQLTSLPGREGRLLPERRIQYTADGLPRQIDDSLRGTVHYQFSPTGQVLQAQGSGALGHRTREQYAYDLAGNLLEAINENAKGEPEASTLGPRSYDGSRLVAAGKVRYQYDAEGRVTQRIEGKRWRGAQRVWQYQWNSDSRLTQLTTPEGRVWRYSYDAFGRRLAKREAAPEGQSYIEIQYLWDGNVLAEEVRLRHTPQADGSLLSETLKSITWDYEPNTWRPLSQTETRYVNHQTERHTYAILTDHLGTPKELLDQDGEIAWAASGDLWGVSEAQKDAATDCPIRFQGQYFDEESQLAYNCQRYYDPSTGRYLSNDPLGLAAGPNPHAYVHNPLISIDPLGLDPKQTKPVDDATNRVGVPVTRSTNPLSPVLEFDAHGNEIMYRTMSEEHFERLQQTGVLPATTETSISPALEYSSKYNGVTVRLTTVPGTSAQLQEIGLAANKPAMLQFPEMSTRTGSWMQDNARFKVEGGQMTTQLGQGKALEIFNSNLLQVERVR